MLDEVGKDLGQLRKICVMESIYALGINIIVLDNFQQLIF